METKFALLTLTPNLNRSIFWLNYAKIAILTHLGYKSSKHIKNLKLIFFQGNLAKKYSQNVVFENGEFWGKTVKKRNF